MVPEGEVHWPVQMADYLQTNNKHFNITKQTLVRLTCLSDLSQYERYDVSRLPETKMFPHSINTDLTDWQGCIELELKIGNPSLPILSG